MEKNPVILIDNVPLSKAKTILADLERLRAVARFLPNPGRITRTEKCLNSQWLQGTFFSQGRAI